MRIDRESRLTALSFTLRPLDREDLPALQALHERCSDYFQLITSEAPRANEAELLLTEVPRGRSPADKLVLGVFSGSNELMGAVDLIRGYPDDSAWWVGLLMLAPEFRGNGLGADVYRACEQRMKEGGARHAWLCVQTQNASALQFWQAQGFYEVGHETQYDGARTSLVHVLRRDL